jgi:hypothetical protein
LKLIHYLITHPQEFRGPKTAFLIALMQTVGGLIAELTNLFMLSSRSTIADCITFFVAFHVLTSIDNIYAEGVVDF